MAIPTSAGDFASESKSVCQEEFQHENISGSVRTLHWCKYLLVHAFSE